MTDYNYRNVVVGEKGGEIDEYLQEIMENQPIEGYSAAARYALRKQMQENRLADAEPETVPEDADRENNEAVFDQ